MKKILLILFISIGFAGCLKKFDSSFWEKGGKWSKLTSNHMHWDEAYNHCQSIGGRLPTISELRTLIKECPFVEPNGECNINISCLSVLECRNPECNGCEPTDDGRYSILGDRGIFWSSSNVEGEDGMVWILRSDGGKISPRRVSYGYYDVRCIKD
ncbi:MAG: hypothetical protein ACOX2F_05545 [bacterium]